MKAVLRTLLLSLALVLLAMGCDSEGKSSAPIATAPQFSSTAAPDARAYVYDLDAMERVHDVAGLGRVPLGLINTVAIEQAAARFDGFYAGESLPSAEHLTLSIITSSARPKEAATNGLTHQASYEWWFRTDNLGVSSIPADHPPDLRIAMQETAAGVWTLEVDLGSGWAPLAGATYNIGVFEVSAEIPLDPVWGMERNTTTTFFRAVTRYDLAVPGDDRAFGWVWPEDLGWREVLYY